MEVEEVNLATVLVPVIHALQYINEGRGEKNKDEFTILNTEHANPESWWNSLNIEQKIDVGHTAIHFHKMTPNYKWDCGQPEYNGKKYYSELSKSQKKIIDFVLKQKEKKFNAIDIYSLILK